LKLDFQDPLESQLKGIRAIWCLTHFLHWFVPRNKTSESLPRFHFVVRIESQLVIPFGPFITKRLVLVPRSPIKALRPAILIAAFGL
jgi:hypothetical protein